MKIGKKGIKEISPIDVYKILPRTNCGECQESNCMAFATKVVNGEAVIEGCSPLYTPKYTKELEKIQDLLAPPVKTITIGTGKRKIAIGGKHVLFRHEFTYHNPPPIAIDIADDTDPDKVAQRVRLIEDFSYTYIGRPLGLDAIAIRSVTKDPDIFREIVHLVCELSDLPLILCSYDPEVLSAGLSECADRNPLIYAIDHNNWKEVGEIALKYSCPVVVSSQGDLSLLRSLVTTMIKWGIDNLVLDPGTFHGEQIGHTIHQFSSIRKTACSEFDPIFGFPLLGTPISIWAGGELSEDLNRWQEAYLTSMLITRYADLLIMHSIEGWALLPQLIWRFGIYTDPRKPVSVDPGVRIFGSPDAQSPVLITTNYALTFFTVESDIKAAKIDCYLIVIDTGGLSVEAAVAGRYLTALKIADSLNEFKAGDLVSHNYLIIPGLAARLSGETEEETGWKVLVGPRDSSGIGQMIRERWPPVEE